VIEFFEDFYFRDDLISQISVFLKVS
jgi:hypothetical protein